MPKITGISVGKKVPGLSGGKNVPGITGKKVPGYGKKNPFKK